jgi:hypothetical protein
VSRARQCAARPHKPSTSGPAPEPATDLRRGHVGEPGRPRELVTLEIAGSNPVVSAMLSVRTWSTSGSALGSYPRGYGFKSHRVQKDSGREVQEAERAVGIRNVVGSIPTASSAAVHRVTGRPVSDGCRFESGSQLQFVGVRGCSFNWQDARL